MLMYQEYTVLVLVHPSATYESMRCAFFCSVTSRLAATHTLWGKRSICLAKAAINGTGMCDRDPISA
jgi:hypothetical protein